MKTKEAVSNHQSPFDTCKWFFEHVQSMFMAVDASGIVQYINTSGAKQLSYTPKEVQGYSLLHLTVEDDHPKLRGIIDQLLQKDIRVAKWEDRKVSRNGKVYWFINEANLLFEHGQHIIAMYCMDVSEQIQREKRFIEQHRIEKKKTETLLYEFEKHNAIGQMAAGIAHEIRNPLTALKGFLQLIQAGYNKAEYTAIMENELNRIEVILNELLSLAKPQEISFEEQHVGELLDEVTTLLDTQAIMNDVQIIIQWDTDHPHIECNKHQIKQVFINFVKNAIEAMSKGGQLQIIVTREKNDMVIRFIDQGCGIPQDKLDKIGNPFFSTKENGTGLGLMVSNHIIETHGGHISVTSKINHGTTFTITLPIKRADEKTGNP